MMMMMMMMMIMCVCVEFCFIFFVCDIICGSISKEKVKKSPKLQSPKS